MELTADQVALYLDKGFGQLLEVAERLGDDRVSERPLGPSTNSVAALISHCAGVCEFWLGHVGLGREDHRDRDAEFVAEATVAELRDLVAASVAQARADVFALDGTTVFPHEADAFRAVPEGATGLALKVLEELYQHLGHAEIAADSLLTP
jgi:hypothetical protein